MRSSAENKTKTTFDIMYKYFPHTPEDIAEMLAKIGADSLDGLYGELPESVRFKGEYDLPSAMSEIEVPVLR